VKTAVHEVARAGVGGVMWQLLTPRDNVVQNRMMAHPTRFERVAFAFGGQGSIYVYVQTGSGLLDQSRSF
jgi:hypothetical protein